MSVTDDVTMEVDDNELAILYIICVSARIILNINVFEKSRTTCSETFVQQSVTRCVIKHSYATFVHYFFM